MSANLQRADPIVLRAMMEQALAEHPVALLAAFEDGSRWTRLEAFRQASAAANELRSAGVRQGGVVALALLNGPDFLRTWWGASLLGAAIAPINPAFRGHLVTHIIETLCPDVLIAEPQFLQNLEEHLAQRLTLLRPSDLIGSNVEAPLLEKPIKPSDAIAFMMTSGTTGPSKAVRISYAHCFKSGTSTYDLWGRRPSDIYLCDVPMFHFGGIAKVYGSIANRNQIAVRSRPDLKNYWEVVRDTGATLSQLFGSMVSFLDAQAARGVERSHGLRLAITVPLPVDREAFRTKFNLEAVLTTWGSTETGGPITLHPGRILPKGSTGQVRPGWHVRIVDKDDFEVPYGQVGEAVVRTDEPWLITTEYVNNFEATAKAWRNGWFHTGDLLRRDDEGNFFFVDRLKDAIRRRGQNISSYEVEAALKTHAGIRDAAVVPVRMDGELEEEVKAWLLVDDPNLKMEDALVFCAGQLPHYMVPRFFEVIDEMPLNHAGKIQKPLLIARGNSAGTWDRLAYGFDVTRAGLSRV